MISRLFLALIGLAACQHSVALQNTTSGGAGSSSGGVAASSGGASTGGSSGQLPPLGCQANCTGKTCGDDGCNGTCGGCPPTKLCLANACSTPSDTADVVVDAKSQLTAISDGIYGQGYFSTDASDLTFIALNRWGGDSTGSYNWKTDIFNTGVDYNCADEKGMFDSPSPSASLTTSADQFVNFNQANGYQTLMTIPLLGWLGNDKITKDYPSDAYCDDDKGDNIGLSCCTHIGTGESILVDGGSSTLDTTYMKDWVSHLVTTFGNAASGGVGYYQLDNEPDNWRGLRADIFPTLYPGVGQCTINYADTVASVGVSLNQDFINRTFAYATAVKSSDPTASVLFMSTENPQDLASLAQNPCGATSQGTYDFDASGTPYWDSTYSVASPITADILRRASAKEASGHVRILDCVDFHYGNGPTAFWTSGTPEAAIQGWINANYPGTGTCLSEYAWPSDLATGADYLGAFGRYGLRLAANWGGLKGAFGGAFIYRNYDGAGAHIGNYSIGAASPVNGFDVYAASDSATAPTTLWIMLVNTTGTSVNKSIVIDNFKPTNPSVAIYRVTDATSAPTASAAGSVAASASGYTVAPVSVPAGEVALLVIPGAIP